MTVYVDDMRAPLGPYVLCHMIADTDAELHAMAEKLHVRRGWFDRDHYDLDIEKRAEAVALGAVAITWGQCGNMVFVRRRTGQLPAPDEAEAACRRLMGGGT